MAASKCSGGGRQKWRHWEEARARGIRCDLAGRPNGAITDAARSLLEETMPSRNATELVDAMFRIGVDQLCAKRLSASLQVSRATLHRLSCAATGMSVRQLFDQARLAVILAAMLSDAVPVHRVATFLGLRDTASLRRVVWRSSGMPIAAIRHRVRTEGREFARHVLEAREVPPRRSHAE